jgi:hypothetical protein
MGVRTGFLSSRFRNQPNNSKRLKQVDFEQIQEPDFSSLIPNLVSVTPKKRDYRKLRLVPGIRHLVSNRQINVTAFSVTNQLGNPKLNLDERFDRLAPDERLLTL